MEMNIIQVNIGPIANLSRFQFLGYKIGNRPSLVGNINELIF